MKTHMSATQTRWGLLRAGIAGLSLALLGAIPAAAQTPVSGPPFPISISAPGSYILSGDITVPFGVTGIIISSGGVDLSLGGHTLKSSGGNGYGVLVTGGTGVRIHHGTIQGFGVGVQLDAPTSGGRVDHVTFAGNPGVGVVDDGSMNKVDQNSVANSWNGILVRGLQSTIKDNEVAAVYGIVLENASNALVKGNRSTGAQAGILLGGATTGNTVMHNTLESNGDGILLAGSGVSGNIVKDNVATQNNVGIMFFAGASGNMVSQNTLKNNTHGIFVGLFGGAPGNTLQDNKAANNTDADLVELTPHVNGMPANIWRRNVYNDKYEDPSATGAIPPSL